MVGRWSSTAPVTGIVGMGCLGTWFLSRGNEGFFGEVGGEGYCFFGCGWCEVVGSDLILGLDCSCMGIVVSDVKGLAGKGKKSSGSRFDDDFYGRFSELDLDSVDEVREIREK